MDESRAARLRRFAYGPDLLKEELRRCPRRMWVFCPGESRWSVHEILFHLADSEAENYLRFRQFIAEPGHDIPAYNAPQWTKSLGYFYQSTRGALEMITLMRTMTYGLLQRAQESVWSHTARHRTRGTLTLDRWLDLQNEHLDRHLSQIRQNFSEWSIRRSGNDGTTRELPHDEHRGVFVKLRNARLAPAEEL